MTAPATTRRAGPFNGNGTTTSFPFTFKVFAASDIAVTRTSAAGIDTVLTLGSDYSVTLNADQDDNPGGSITYPITGTPLAVGEKLTAVGALPYDQTADLPTGGNYRAQVVENALDRGVMQVQQLAEQIGRALTLPVSAAGADTELPAPEAGKVIGWDALGGALQNYDPAAAFVAAAFANWITDVFVGDGVTTAFALQAAPGSLGNIDVSIAGVTQVAAVDYSLAGSTLTFTSAPASGAVVFARYGSAAVQGSSTSFSTQTVAAGVTSVPVGATYVPGSNGLVVFADGFALTPGVDYTENSATTITLTAATTATTEFLFIVGRLASGSTTASEVVVQDTGGYFTGATAEAALQELGAAAIKAPWHFTKDSPVLLSLRHSVSGNILQQWQDGTPGTATYFYRGLSIQTDSHSVQMGPATNGGSCDLLWQRSTVNADPGGNRFNLTFEESNDRLLLSYATSAGGAPVFDSAMQVYAGTSPQLLFPAIAAQFNAGVGVKQRAAGGFECRFVPTSSTVADIKQIGGSGTTFISFRDGAMGFFGSSGTSRPTVTGSRGGNAALASLLTALAGLGLITDSTTA